MLDEETELAVVQVVCELQINAKKAPIAGQPDDEIAARLAGAVAAELALSAEDSLEGDEAVIPVVVAWNGGDLGRAEAAR